MRSGKASTLEGSLWLTIAFLAGSGICCAADEATTGARATTAEASDLYLKVQLDNSLKISKLKSGDVVEGKLVRNVYSSNRQQFSAGSRVRLTVDHLEKRRRVRNDHWPWVVNVFTPRKENFPVFKTADISAAGGDRTMQVSMLSLSRKREVQAQANKKKTGRSHDEAGSVEVSRSGGMWGSGKLAAPVMVLEANDFTDTAAAVDDEHHSPAADIGELTIPAGTACKILLLGSVSASKSKVGDEIRARLLEPVFLNAHLALPAGSLFEGKIVKRTPPRWGSRSGSLYLTFTGVTLPGGNAIPISASLTGAELDRSSHTRIDREGQLRGERPGKAWMAINIGVTAGLAKEVDDATQLIVEALITTATDASTAGTARIISSCVSGIFMVSRHGRDVVLPRFTEMNIALDRPVSVSTGAGTVASASPVHGN